MNPVTNLTRVEDEVSFDVELPGGKNLHVVAGGLGHKALEITVPGTDFGVDVDSFYMEDHSSTTGVDASAIVEHLPAVHLFPAIQGSKEGCPVGIKMNGGVVNVYCDDDEALRVADDVKKDRRFTDVEGEALGSAIMCIRNLARRESSSANRLDEICEILIKL